MNYKLFLGISFVLIIIFGCESKALSLRVYTNLQATTLAKKSYSISEAMAMFTSRFRM